MEPGSQPAQNLQFPPDIIQHLLTAVVVEVAGDAPHVGWYPASMGWIAGPCFAAHGLQWTADGGLAQKLLVETRAGGGCVRAKATRCSRR